MANHVYWSARDLSGSPIGNHHFLLIVFENKAVADLFNQRHSITYMSEAVDQKNTYFATLGGFCKDGKLVFEANNRTDVKAVREWIDPEKHTSWYKPDLDLENHEINPRKLDSSDTNGMKLVDKISNAAKTYQRKGPVNYRVNDENCSCWVNTLLKSVGFSAEYRHLKGEFYGVDWGEEDTIGVDLFK
jgi:hypothetical protein